MPDARKRNGALRRFLQTFVLAGITSSSYATQSDLVCYFHSVNILVEGNDENLF